MTTFTADITVSLTDLYTITGSTATVQKLEQMMPQAISVIETISGVFFEAVYRENTISFSDAAWLKRAATYQAQFMLENEILSARSVSSVSQDGLSVSAPDGLVFVLAPLARRALGNCAWAKSGTLKVQAPGERAAVDITVSDDHAWFPLRTV